MRGAFVHYRPPRTLSVAAIAGPPSSQFQTTNNQISDALIKMGVPSGGLVPDLKMYSPVYEAGDTRIAGPAFTVEVS